MRARVGVIGCVLVLAVCYVAHVTGGNCVNANTRKEYSETERFEHFERDQDIGAEREERGELETLFRSGAKEAQTRAIARERAEKNLKKNAMILEKSEEHPRYTLSEMEQQMRGQVEEAFRLEAQAIETRAVSRRAVTQDESDDRARVEQSEQASMSSIVHSHERALEQVKKHEEERVHLRREESANRAAIESGSDPLLSSEIATEWRVLTARIAELKASREEFASHEADARGALKAALEPEMNPMTDPTIRDAWKAISEKLSEREYIYLQSACENVWTTFSKEEKDGELYYSFLGPTEAEISVYCSELLFSFLKHAVGKLEFESPKAPSRNESGKIVSGVRFETAFFLNKFISVVTFSGSGFWLSPRDAYFGFINTVHAIKGPSLTSATLNEFHSVGRDDLLLLVKDSPNLRLLHLSGSSIRLVEASLDSHDRSDVSLSSIQQLKWISGSLPDPLLYEFLGGLIRKNAHPQKMILGSGKPVLTLESEGEDYCKLYNYSPRGPERIQTQCYADPTRLSVKSNDAVLPVIEAQALSPRPNDDIELPGFFLSERLGEAYLTILNTLPKAKVTLNLPSLAADIECGDKQCHFLVQYYSTFVDKLREAVDQNGTIRTVRPFFEDRIVERPTCIHLKFDCRRISGKQVATKTLGSEQQWNDLQIALRRTGHPL